MGDPIVFNFKQGDKAAIDAQTADFQRQMRREVPDRGAGPESV